MRTLHARASELERSFTFGVVRQLFEPALFSAADAERDRWLSGAAGLTRSMFEDAGAGHDESSYARLHGLYWLCANLAADGPLLVCVDDAQWVGRAEPELPRLPRPAARGPAGRARRSAPARAPSRRARCCAAWSPTPPRGPAAADADQRRRRPVGARRGRPVRRRGLLRRLPRDHRRQPVPVRELLHEVLDKQLRATDAEAATVRELGPEAISTVVLQRLHRLPATAPAMARAVALLGEGASPALAAELAGLDVPTAEEALEALCRGDVLTRDGDALDFVHPIVLSAIYNDLPVRARSEGHGRAARLLSARGAAPEEVASQLALTAPAGDDWVVEALRAAAARATSLGDPVAAAAHLTVRWPSRRRTAARSSPSSRAPRRSRARPAAVEHFREAMGWQRRRPSAGASRSGSRAA